MDNSDEKKFQTSLPFFKEGCNRIIKAHEETKRENERLKISNSDKEKEIENLKNIIKDLKSHNKNVNEKLTQAYNDLSNERNKSRDLEKLQNRNGLENDNLQNTLNEMKCELENVKGELKSAKEKSTHLNNELKTIKRENRMHNNSSNNNAFVFNWNFNESIREITDNINNLNESIESIFNFNEFF